VYQSVGSISKPFNLMSRLDYKVCRVSSFVLVCRKDRGSNMPRRIKFELHYMQRECCKGIERHFEHSRSKLSVEPHSLVGTAT
jgi:hypothetical protein